MSHAAMLAQLHKASFNPAWDEDAIISLLTSSTMAWLGYIDDQPSGFVIIRIAADEAEILSIAVLPDARQHGLGRTLLTTAFEGAVQSGAISMFLEVARSNEPACQLYESVGFAHIGVRERYYSNDEDALVFRRSLV